MREQNITEQSKIELRVNKKSLFYEFLRIFDFMRFKQEHSLALRAGVQLSRGF